MAKETKAISVHPDLENEAMNAYQCFGWEVLSTQDVFSQTTHEEGGFFTNYVTVVKETTHYTKITFQRDPATLKNYAQLRTLEQKYDTLPGPGECPSLYSGLWIFIGLLCGTIPGIIFIAKNSKAKAEIPKWEQRCREYNSKRQAILDEALTLSLH